MKIADVIKHGLIAGKTLEEINEVLKEYGCDFHLEKNDKNGWTEQEMKEGFIRNENQVDAIHLYDVMKFSKENAGTKKLFTVVEGKYEVEWDAEGHPICATKKK